MNKNTMRYWVAGFTGLLTLFCANSYGQAERQSIPTPGSDFRAFLPEWERAINDFVNGNPTLWKQICSQSEDATIFGGFGGYEKSWKEVGPRYDWAATQFKKSGAKIAVEYINIVVSGALAYIVVIERGEQRIGNMEKPTMQALRSTQIFRKENGGWKLLHRHADALIDKKTPTDGHPKESHAVGQQ